MIRSLTLAALILPAAFTIAPAAHAEEPKLEATYSDWRVYSRGSGNSRICYALAMPSEQSPRAVNHGKVFFMVANWQNGAAKEQPSLITGYAFKRTSPPHARVGSTKIPMYVSQNEAFVESDGDETKLVKTMKNGSVMRVSAVSERGTATSYEFSLKGITAATRKASALCR
ncbi:invasion associated locus B family protein [Robiginitomaculum antarcticum]|uniref:invasion associated locus B family protein n=1 Tax=Robiginitomaculum antarcticum TaxID=437507 RepID=UPI001F2AE699|nr:invasion associated locus B family protein [Robiginitomaculum antarcticum]